MVRALQMPILIYPAFRERSETVGALVVEGGPLGRGSIEPEYEVAVKELEWGREARV